MSFTNTTRFIRTHPLTKGKPIASLTRYLKWQIGSRLVPGKVIVEWVNGSRFVAGPGEAGLTGNIYAGLHEFEDMAFLLHVLRPEDLFLDVGANVGSYSILACSSVGARGIAMEPVPSTFARLMQNARVNSICDTARFLNVAAGEEPGSVEFTTGLDTVNHVVSEGERCGETAMIKITTIDTVVADESPVVMKMDVEGFETPALKGATETLKKKSLHSVILELNGAGERYGHDESKIVELMLDHGFRTFRYRPFERELVSLDGKNLDSGNTLFVRGDEHVAERLRTAEAFTVLGRRI